MFYIYIVYSSTSDIFYVGYTNNFIRRFAEHNESEKKTFTSKHRSWILKAVFSCGEIEADAMRIEKFIKKQKSRKLLERLMAEEILTGVLAQLVSIPQVPE